MLMKKVFLSIALGLLVSSSSWAVKAHEIKVDKKDYSLNIAYPEEFIPAQIDIQAEKVAQSIKKQFLDSLGDEVDLPASVPGKSGLTITYELPMQNKTLTSIKYNVSVYNRGAAHPNNYIQTLNFFQGNPILLQDLFKTKSPYLKGLSQYCSKQLLKNKDFDKKWISEGTAPSLKNYSKWYFTPKGLAIIFDTYQVAAYVYGPQIIEIPYAQFKANLNPLYAKGIWG